MAKTKSLSSHPSSLASIFYLIDPPSDMEKAIFELDPIGLAAAEKFDGILADERHVPQIQSQSLPGCLGGERCWICSISSVVSIRPLSVYRT
jgi:hypothetical protein